MDAVLNKILKRPQKQSATKKQRAQLWEIFGQKVVALVCVKTMASGIPSPPHVVRHQH